MSSEIVEIVSAYAQIKSSVLSNVVDWPYPSPAVERMMFFVYDYSTTFHHEVRYIWRRRVTIASALFLSIRCKVAQWMEIILKYSIYLPFAVFSGARAYALYRSWSIAGFITLLSLGPMCVNWADWAIFETPELNPIFGCVVGTTVILQDNTILTAILTYRFVLDLRKANEQNVKIGSDDPELQMSMNTHSSLSFVDRALDSLAATIIPGAPGADDEHSYDEDLQPSEDGEGANREHPPNDVTLMETQEVLSGI
ncbi:hypothetical protein C8Q80DRAFT_1271670 [Daedaleopsis nitida]|nr:hypothetical protein C8Q80DRAFT_1271670 [Daedaleopsis nitida]